MTAELTAPGHPIQTSVSLSGSKSITNRLLILDAVTNSGRPLQNVSDSEDSVLLKQALTKIKAGPEATLDLHHAGTDMRFLTAYLSTRPGSWVLTGSERLKQRPIGPLVNALQALGADIAYLDTEGFPPLRIQGKKLSGGKVKIDAGISSQFISALLLMAPALPNGLEIELEGDTVSGSYIHMTIELLKLYGIEVEVLPGKLNTQSSQLPALSKAEAPTLNSKLSTLNSQLSTQNSQLTIESDWSSASYWYSICALSPNSRITLQSLYADSLQADSILSRLFEPLGVTSDLDNGQLTLTNTGGHAGSFIYDFTACPDIAQTLAATCFGLGISAKLTGLKTLTIKESDRITALKTELGKLGAGIEAGSDFIRLAPRRQKIESTGVILQTWSDHRMAMSLAPLCLVCPGLSIGSPKVVSKSYPAFWEDLKTAGFSVTLRA